MENISFKGKVRLASATETGHAWKANLHAHHGESFVMSGNLPGLRNLVGRWAGNPAISADPRLNRFQARVTEMEAIERSHGYRSLVAYADKTPRRGASEAERNRFTAQVERAENLRKLKGEDWWSWAHKSCLN